MPRTNCCHCVIRRCTRPLDLCSVCWFNPVVREKVRREIEGMVRERRGGGDAESRAEGAADRRMRRVERQPGEPAWRCFWCWRFRCSRPLQLCPECEATYQQLSAGMPTKMNDD
jgi:hypothetical protein